jgi:inhibitor of cysteine peptidase
MSTLTLTQTENRQTFNVQTQDQILVRLEESPTTGYRWAVDQFDQNILVLQNSDFSPTSSGVGGGGNRTFSFTAQNAGTTSLNCKLWREWEGDSSVSSRFNVVIVVK